LWNIGQNHYPADSNLVFIIGPSMYDISNGNVIEHRYSTYFYSKFDEQNKLLNQLLTGRGLKFYDADFTFNTDEPLSTLKRPSKPISAKSNRTDFALAA